MANCKKDTIINVVMHVLALQLFPLPKLDKAIKSEFLSRVFHFCFSRSFPDHSIQIMEYSFLILLKLTSKKRDSYILS